MIPVHPFSRQDREWCSIWCALSSAQHHSQGMIFRVDTGVTPYEIPWKTDLTVIFLELCEARTKLEKIIQKENLNFFLLAMAVPVLGHIKKASLNGCFGINFFYSENGGGVSFFLRWATADIMSRKVLIKICCFSNAFFRVITIMDHHRKKSTRSSLSA